MSFTLIKISAKPSLLNKLDSIKRLPAGDDYIGVSSLNIPKFLGTVRLPSGYNSLFKKAVVTVTPISSIVTAQGYLQVSKLKDMLDKDIKIPVNLIRQDGQLILVDGNHRLASAILLGKKEILSKIVDAKAPKR